MRRTATVSALLVVALGGCRGASPAAGPRAALAALNPALFLAQLHPHAMDAGAVDASAAPDDVPHAASSAPCASDGDCRANGHRGVCFTASLAAQYTQSFARCEEAQQWRREHATGTCLYDECTDEGSQGDSCPAGQRCATLLQLRVPQRRCLSAPCAYDQQCHARGAGRCLAYPPSGRCHTGGWACSYVGDHCAPRDAVRLCPTLPGVTSYCAPVEGHFRCVQEPVL